MGDIHQLVISKGRDFALQAAANKHERMLVEIASQVLAEEQEKIGISHSGFALTALPHKETSAPTWKREGHRCTLIIQSGIDRDEKTVGIPYGSKSRMILLYLQTQAVRSQSRYVELGASMRSWLESMGLSIGGNTYKQVAEQANRISRCRLTFWWDGEAATAEVNGAFVKTAIRPAAVYDDGRQGQLWSDTVELDDAFYGELLRHPVPLSESALRTISGKSMALDIYIWLAYRLHSLSKPTPISFLSLHQQFGSSYAIARQFKPDFLKNLAMALAAYPEAKVSAEDGGLILHPSAPPIRQTVAAIGGRQ